MASWSSPEGVAAIAAASATIFAAISVALSKQQLNASARDAKVARTIDQLRRVQESLRGVRSLSLTATCEEVLQFYGPSRGELGEEARSYLAFLDELELLAHAHDEGVVEVQMVQTYLGGLLSGSRCVSQDFITQLREGGQDGSIYQHLEKLIATAEFARRQKGLSRAPATAGSAA